MSQKTTATSSNSKASDSSDSSDSDEVRKYVIFFRQNISMIFNKFFFVFFQATDSSTSSSDSSSDDSNHKKTPSVTQFAGLRMKISTVASGRQTANNNNNKVKNGSRETESSALPQSKQSFSKRRDSSPSFCSSCTDSDSDSSALSVNERRHSKAKKSNSSKRLSSSVFEKMKNAKTNGRSAIDSSAVDSTSDSSDDDDDDDDDSSECVTAAKRLLGGISSKNVDSKKRNKRNEYKKCSTATPSSAKPIPTAAQLKNNRTENLATCDGASSSDMELPALVNAAIQSVEFESDVESTTKATKTTHYTSSLLRDFVAKTQMIGSQSAPTIEDTEKNGVGTTKPNATKECVDEVPKKKRGRPRKNPALNVNVPSLNKTSESPDSGITSTPHSPVLNGEHASTTLTKRIGRPITKAAMKQQAPLPKKLDLARLEKCMYATERVLYPPRRTKRSASRPPERTTRPSETESVDPMWRKIDITKKFRRPSTCGYKSDGGTTICSKVLAAQSGYVSDYGNVNRRIFSGYKSDYSCKSRRSGYRSDFSVRAKSCGYRSDCSVASRRRVRRKRRTKRMSTTKATPTISDLDILQLAGLTLGHSDEQSTDSHDKIENVLTKKRAPSVTSFREIFHSNSFEGFGLKSKFSASTNAINADVYKEIRAKTALKLDSLSPAQIRKRRSSAISHCSSRCSTIGSRHPLHRRRRRRLKSHTALSEPNLAKLNAQLDTIITSFASQCTIFAEKPSKETSSTSTTKASTSKRTVKKRKGNENAEAATNATPSATTGKRRHKKTVQTKSPDDHKLPLKKRHYLLTPGEKSEQKATGEQKSQNANDESGVGDGGERAKTNQNSKESTENESNSNGKAVTPKKRHLLGSPSNQNQSTPNAPSDAVTASIASIPATTTSTTTTASKSSSAASRRSDAARKKSQSSKATNVATNHTNTSTTHSTPATTTTTISSSAMVGGTAKTQSSRTSIVRTTIHEPPPGVFVPSVDLELQIPFTSISTLTTPRISPAMTTDVAQLAKTEKVVEKLLTRTGGHLILKRKRKKINRTGFPTLKKKKKKPTGTATMASNENSIKTNEVSSTTADIDLNATVNSSQSDKTCDRVPVEGEATNSFIERDNSEKATMILTEKTTNDATKRHRETSEEKNNSRERKKHKHDRIAAIESEKCELSSDSEPLINLVSKRKASVQNNVKEIANKNVEGEKNKKEIHAAKNKTTEKIRAKSVDRSENETKMASIKRRRESICVPRLKRSRGHVTDIESYSPLPDIERLSKAKLSTKKVIKAKEINNKNGKKNK